MVAGMVSRKALQMAEKSVDSMVVMTVEWRVATKADLWVELKVVKKDVG